MSTHTKTQGFAYTIGDWYDIKLPALLFLRALQTREDFLLATNMKAAECFEDVVLTVGDCTMFLKLKHEENSEVLKIEHFATNSNFNLPRYLKSYLNIKQHWQEDPDLQRCGKFENAKFIIYSNDKVVEELVNTADNEEIMNIVSNGRRCTMLTELFDNLPKYKDILSATVSSENIIATPDLLDIVHKLYNKEAQCIPSKEELQKILEHLESLGDLTNYKQFISQFYLCTGNITEEDMDGLMRHAIHSETMLEKFLAEAEKWRRTSNSYLTKESQFWLDIVNTNAAKIIKESSKINVKFSKDHCDTIRQNFTSGSRMFYVYTECTSLTSIKIMQSFQRNLFIDASILETNLSEVVAVLRFGAYDVLVVDGEGKDSNIFDELARMPDSKYVAIISNNQQTQLCQQFKFDSFTDTFSLSQLDYDSQRAILEHEIIFQGYPVKLNSLANTSFFKNALTGDIVCQLNKTLEVGQKLNELETCYISRTFIRKEYVSEQIFKEENITLALTGVSEDVLSSLESNDVQKCNLQKNVGKKTRKYFLIEGDDEFNALSEVNDDIHWIQAFGEGLLWKKSKGNISPILKHLEKKCVRYSAEEVLALSHKVVLLVAESGMGKSTEICNIAHIIKEKDPFTWVVTVDLNRYTHFFDQNEIDPVDFLKTAASLNTEFQKRLFEHQLQSKGNVVILLDGFDEMNQKHSEKVFSLLWEFSLTNIDKIFVTSRPFILEQLQQKFSTLAFSFEAFTLEDQQNFLARYWNQSPNDPYLVSKFILILLKIVQNSLNDKTKEVSGKPLHCKLLGEVFQNEASYYCQTGVDILPHTLDVLQLYDMYIHKKCKVYCKKNGVDTNKADDLVECLKYYFQESFTYCALVSYFHDNYVKNLYNSQIVLKQNQKFVERFKNVPDKTGIVTGIVNEKAVFIHRTFTEFFVAMWCSREFHSELNSVKNIYFDKNFEIVQIFLDRMLAQEFKLHTAVLNKNLCKVKHLLSTENCDVNQKDKGGRTALHLAVMNNYYYSEDNVNDSIIDILLEYDAEVNCKDKVLDWRPLRIAEEIRAWFVVEKLLEKQADNTDLIWIRGNTQKQNPLQVTRSEDLVGPENNGSECEVNAEFHVSVLLQQVMYTALSEGYANLVQFILKCGVSVGHYITNVCGRDSMLNIAAQHGHRRVLQLLVENGAVVEMADEVGKNSPLILAAQRGHVEVVELLINQGASVNVRNESGDTALSIAVLKEKYEVVELLLQKGGYVEILGENNLTPLMWTAVRGHVKETELLLNYGAYINARDIYGSTALALSILVGKYESVDLLLRKGADVGISNKYNVTPLMRAALSGHVQIVELLINLGASVNARESYGYTALSLAACEENYEIVDLLLQKGADVEMSDWSYKKSPLMHAAECGHVQIAKLLINHKASVNARSELGYTALCLAAREGKYEVVDLLLQEGADVHVCDVYNHTSLMWAARYGHLQIVELLIKHGYLVNAKGKYGETAQSLAAYFKYDNIVELLIQHGENE